MIVGRSVCQLLLTGHVCPFVCLSVGVSRRVFGKWRIVSSSSAAKRAGCIAAARAMAVNQASSHIARYTHSAAFLPGNGPGPARAHSQLIRTTPPAPAFSGVGERAAEEFVLIRLVGLTSRARSSKAWETRSGVRSWGACPGGGCFFAGA